MNENKDIIEKTTVLKDIKQEEGEVKPTREVLDIANKLIENLLKQSLDLPTRSYPNGEGGIILERKEQVYETFEIFNNLEIELSLYKNSKLEKRRRFSLL